MLTALLLLGAVRNILAKSFRALPPLPAAASLPADVSCLRFSLMRALQAMRSTALQQVGSSGIFECYVVGHSLLQPAIAGILIANGWVVAGQPHWVEAIVQYHLSATGQALRTQLEAWWANLTLAQRLRAALLE